MAQTFDIRFARVAGLVAMFEAPTNSFRWTGAGRLSIDPQGISIAVKRGLLSLLARNRTQRIPSASLKEVFREGDALRLEFATDDSARASLLFWAHDRDVAAQIVRLMPTSRTVELEENSSQRNFRLNWRAITLLVAVLAATMFGVTAIRTERAVGPAGEIVTVARTPPASEPGTRLAETQAVASQAPASTTSTKLPAAGANPSSPMRAREIVIPVYQNRPTQVQPEAKTPELVAAVTNDPDTLASAAALEAITTQPTAPAPIIFRVRVSADGIVPIVPGMASYQAAREQMRLFIEESQRGLWWEMTVRIHNSPDFDDPALWPLRDAELAASRASRTYDGEFAQMLTARVYQYVN